MAPAKPGAVPSGPAPARRFRVTTPAYELLHMPYISDSLLLDLTDSLWPQGSAGTAWKYAVRYLTCRAGLLDAG